jgi:hypothetical protein
MKQVPLVESENFYQSIETIDVDENIRSKLQELHEDSYCTLENVFFS